MPSEMHVFGLQGDKAGQSQACVTLRVVINIYSHNIEKIYRFPGNATSEDPRETKCLIDHTVT